VQGKSSRGPHFDVNGSRMVRLGEGSGLTAEGSDVTSEGFHNKPVRDPDGRMEVAGAWLTFQAISGPAVWVGIRPAPSAHREEGGSRIDCLAAPTLPTCDKNLLSIPHHRHGTNV
jgi:hypothetical protein